MVHEFPFPVLTGDADQADGSNVPQARIGKGLHMPSIKVNKGIHG